MFYYKVQIDILPLQNAKTLCALLPETAKILFSRKYGSAIVFICNETVLPETFFELEGESLALTTIKKPKTDNMLAVWKSVKSF